MYWKADFLMSAYQGCQEPILISDIDLILAKEQKFYWLPILFSAFAIYSPVTLVKSPTKQVVIQL